MAGTVKRGKKKSGPPAKTAANRRPTAAQTREANARKQRLKEEIVAIIFLAFGVFLFFSLLVPFTGKLGAAMDHFLKGLFGAIAFTLPFFFLLYGILLLIRNELIKRIRNIILVILFFLLLLIINSGHFIDSEGAPITGKTFGDMYGLGVEHKSGGILGMYMAMGLVKLIGKTGLYIFSIVGLLITALLLVGKPLSPLFERFRDWLDDRREARMEEDGLYDDEEADEFYDREEPVKSRKPVRAQKGAAPKYSGGAAERRPPLNLSGGDDADTERKKKNILDSVKNDPIHGEAAEGMGLDPARDMQGYGLDGYDEPAVVHAEEPDIKAPEIMDPAPATLKKKDRKPAQEKPVEVGFSPDRDEGFSSESALANYRLPPVDLLNKGPKNTRTESAQELRFRAQRLEQTLRDFRVDAKVIKVTVGPTVTRYEVEPDVGVKIQSIKSLEQDLALKLEVRSVRVVPMPGHSVVGIEAYNANTSLVTLRDIIDSSEFRTEESKIAFALGKNISGKRMIGDLKVMPHLLIAGTTGSGKSVCINSILLSILFRARPDEVKLILVDPKVVELKSYNDIPHLLVPVVTEPERAATALGYAVTLMNERYNKFAECNVRNLEAYNKLMHKEGRQEDVLPQIVIVIDELSDLMMIAPAKVQESISRLAAMARAAGMHLIVATQQPLASILTSVIKANIPSRIAFSVSSNSSSRVILDDGGAERLHGNGDMLFSPVGSREPMRIQGSFVSDSEVHKVTEYVKREMDPDYSIDIMEIVSGEPTGQLVDEEDELFKDALEMVVTTKQASISMIQRRFRIGYNRAARLVDMMEERGIVAPSDGANKPRKVLITEAQLPSYLGTGAPAEAGSPEEIPPSAASEAADEETEREDPPFDLEDGDG